MTLLQIWSIVFAILSINSKTETERVVFKVLAVICLIIPFLYQVAGGK